MQSQALAEGPTPICISPKSHCYTFFMNVERELATDCCCKSLLLGRGPMEQKWKREREKNEKMGGCRAEMWNVRRREIEKAVDWKGWGGGHCTSVFHDFKIYHEQNIWNHHSVHCPCFFVCSCLFYSPHISSPWPEPHIVLTPILVCSLHSNTAHFHFPPMTLCCH